MKNRITAEELIQLYAQYNLSSRTLYKHFATKSQLSTAQRQVLRLLHTQGDMRMGDLSRLLSISRPNLTPLIEKLAVAGLVARQTREDDRRVTHISLTQEGAQLFEREHASLCARLDKTLRRLNDEDIDALATALRATIDIAAKL